LPTKQPHPFSRIQLIRRKEDLPPSFVLYPREERFFEQDRPARVGALPFSVTGYFLGLVGEREDDPLRRQCIPTDREFETLSWEVEDPLDEEPRQPVTDVIHRYHNRVLLRVTDECALYCRYCFRRFFSGGRRAALSSAELQEVAEYLRRHPEVKECILSGGDPLTLGAERLEELMTTLRSRRPDIVVRIASRIPVVAPQTVDGSLAEMLRRFAPLFVVTQFNHSREITRESARAAAVLVDAGIPVLNQSVLLRGVNDSAEELGRLFQGLVSLRIKPYYLFQGDLARGTAHFRVPLGEGLALVEKLRRSISGVAMPVYALDLPGGGGKIPLTEQYLLEKRNDEYLFRSPEGGVYRYPAE